MNKKRLHHYWRRLKWLKPWYFLVLAAVFGIICTTALRSNYEHMTVLRSEVYAADKNDTDVVAALNSLRTYVYSHMNTSLATSDGVYPPVQLKYTYDRLVTAESARVATANSQIYTDAQAYCETQDSVDFSGHNRVPCITDYVNSHGTVAKPIPDALYKFDFASPRWSPDLAGWSMVIAILSVLAATALFIIRRLAKS